MKKILALILAVLMMCTLFVGCSQSGDNNTDDASNDTQLEEFDVVLDWYPNAVHAFLYQAIEKGYFEEEGLKVNIYFPASSSDSITMPAAGRADIGFYYQQDIIIAKANENVPIKVIGTVVHEPLDIVASIADKNIKTPQDLLGKKIGHSGVPFSEVAVSALLSSIDATLDDVEFIDVGFDLMSSMTTGTVDATFGCFVNHEIPALDKEGFETNLIHLTDYGVPNDYALVLVAGEKDLSENPDKYVRFMRACKKGFEDMKADPEESLDLMMNNQNAENFPLDAEVEKVSFDILLPMMEKDDAPFLSQDAAVWQENIDWLYSAGMIDNKFAPEDLLVDLSEE